MTHSQWLSLMSHQITPDIILFYLSQMLGLSERLSNMSQVQSFPNYILINNQERINFLTFCDEIGQ